MNVEIRLLPLFLLCLALIAPLPLVYGHASLVSSDPPQGAILESAPARISLRFTEQLEPSFSSISVLDSSGTRVDRQDVTFSQDKLGMSVSLPGLKEGIYVVSWKALSAVDGHITEGSFPIGIGNVSLSSFIQPRGEARATAFPSPWEVFLRWVTYASQTALIGSIAFQLFLWKPLSRYLKDRKPDSDGIAALSFNRTLWVSLALTASSTIAWLPLQVFTVSSGSLEAILKVLLETRFGLIWAIRIVVIAAVASILYTYGQKPENDYLAWLLGIGTGALLLTTSLNSHNAGVTQFGILPLLADWVHLIGVGIWVGGLFQMVITLSAIYRKAVGSLSSILTLLIPRFSLMAVLSIAAISVSGFFSSLVQLKSFDALLTSTYGSSLLVKLLLVIPIVLLGAINQFKIHSSIIRKPSTATSRRFLRSVRLEVGLAITVLLIAGVLTSIPPPSLSSSGSQSSPDKPLVVRGASEGVIVQLQILPGRVGVNEFRLYLSDVQGKNITDVRDILLEFRPRDASIGASRATATPNRDGSYGVVGGYLSLQGMWDIQVQVRRQQAYDAVISFEVSVQRQATSSKLNMVEFQLPVQGASPYDVTTDGQGKIWFTLPQLGSIGKFDPQTRRFDVFKIPEQGVLPNRITTDRNWIVWFTDPQGNRVFNFNPNTTSFRSYRIPTPYSVPGPIVASNDGKIWFAELLGNKVARLDTSTGEVTEYPIPTPNSGIESLAVGEDGDVWFTESTGNKIGRLDVRKGLITEYMPRDFQLGFPAGIAIDGKGLVWFSEHGANRITVLNPVDGSFKSYKVKGFPYGVAIDGNGDVWFAEHMGNAIGVLRISDGVVEEYPIPTPQSNTQWIAIDQHGTVWFAESSGNRLGAYGSIEASSQVLQIEPFFANTLFVSSIAVIALAALFTFGAWRRMRKSVSSIQMADHLDR